MRYRLRFTPEAKADLERLFRFMAEQDFVAASHALEVIDSAWSLLEQFPFSCRKPDESRPLLRELVISFGRSGFVALFEIDAEQSVTVLAVRHQREDDYY